jgi:three-Cys-motif partner protein
MKSQWPQRAYVGLYSGAGRARLEETDEIVETTAMSIFRLPDPFTHHIFVDNDARCTEALTERIRSLLGERNVTVFTGDVNILVSNVREALPAFSSSKGLLSYCFVDPFAANLKFETLRSLGQLRMDFLILLMLGLDARLNFKTYLEDERDTRIAELVDSPNWRDEWRRESKAGRPNVVHFLMGKFDVAMTRIGYRSAPPDHALSVKVRNKGVLIYQLVFYSKNELGQKFWKQTRTGIKPQLDLSL